MHHVSSSGLSRSINGAALVVSMRPLCCLVLSVVSSSALADIYSWEDKDGLHYVDAPEAVPKTAKNPKRLTTEPEPPKPASAPSPTQTIVVRNAQARVWEDTAGLSEAQWRERFVLAVRRVEALEQELATAKATLPPPQACGLRMVMVTNANGTLTPTQLQGCDPNPEHARVTALIATKQLELSEARRDLEQLERNASLQSVPREWRRGW